MSLYVTLAINDDTIGTVAITRTTSHGEQPDSVNFYRWQYWTTKQPDPRAIGYIEHRYGDGALTLSRMALDAVIERLGGA